MSLTSSISIGEEDGFDLEGPLTIRECINDENYPVAIEGVTVGGHDVSISLSRQDIMELSLFFGSY